MANRSNQSRPTVFQRLTQSRLNRQQRKALKRQLYSDNPGLDVVHPDAAGIDIGSRSHFVAVAPGRDSEAVREFGSWTADLERMAEWLKSLGIRTVAMQSTGVYWIAAYDVLEKHGLGVFLVNARDTKNLPGRKSDVQECQWVLKLHTYGLLRNSFRPTEKIREMRTLWRLRDQHVKEASRCVQHMQKTLTSMNVQLANAISDLSGASGQAIIGAILEGERDPYKLAELRDRRIKASKEEVARSLEGNWQADQLFALRQAVDEYAFRQKQIGQCDEQLKALLDTLPTARVDTPAPTAESEGKAEEGNSKRPKRKRPTGNMPKSFDLREELRRICGVDLTRIPGIDVMTVQTLVSEVGTDLKSSFPDESHFASWLNACPRPNITGGKVTGYSREKSNNRVLAALRMAATTLLNSDSYLGAKYRQLRMNKGAPKAIKAMARQLACLIYRMLTKGEEWVERGKEHFERRRAERELHTLTRKAAEKGFKLVPVQT
jgi:transposase